MSKEAERIYLTNKMKARANELGFPISYPNQPFNIPVNDTYGEFHIISGPRPIIVGGEGKGKVRVRYVGMVQLTVFVPKEKGTKKATMAQDVFKEIFSSSSGGTQNTPPTSSASFKITRRKPRPVGNVTWRACPSNGTRSRMSRSASNFLHHRHSALTR